MGVGPERACHANFCVGLGSDTTSMEHAVEAPRIVARGAIRDCRRIVTNLSGRALPNGHSRRVVCISRLGRRFALAALSFR